MGMGSRWCGRSTRITLVALLALGLSFGTAPVAAPGPAPAPPERAPETYAVQIATTRGDIVVEVRRAMAPNAADRFYHLVRNSHFARMPFFFSRKDDSQTGIEFGGWPAAESVSVRSLPLDAPQRRVRAGDIVFVLEEGLVSNPSALSFDDIDRGYWYKVSQNIANTVRIATGVDADAMSRDGFAPFGRVVRGMDVVGRISAVPNSVVLKLNQWTKHPSIARQVADYVRKHPGLDSLVQATLVDSPGTEGLDLFPAAEDSSLAASGQAQITIYRYDEIGMARQFIGVDGVPRANLTKRTMFSVRLPAGRHSLSAETRIRGIDKVISRVRNTLTNAESLRFDLRPGQRCFLRAAPRGEYGQNVLLIQVASDIGAEDVAALSPATLVEPAENAE